MTYTYNKSRASEGEREIPTWRITNLERGGSITNIHHRTVAATGGFDEKSPMTAIARVRWWEEKRKLGWITRDM